jgi:hypothetical protein
MISGLSISEINFDIKKDSAKTHMNFSTIFF